MPSWPKRLLLAMIIVGGFRVPDARAQFGEIYWDFSIPMLAVHAVPAVTANPDCSQAPVAVGCDLWPGSPLNVQAELQTDYDLYIYAMGIDSAQGLSEVSFNIAYNDTAGIGMDVLGWSSCGDQVTPEAAWPSSGSGIRIVFAAGNCQGGRPDSLVTALHRGLVPLLTLRVRAYSNDSFAVIPGESGTDIFKSCSGNNYYVMGLGEIGFGYNWGWDPCDTYSESHLCYGGYPGFSCSCCYEHRACRPLAFYYSRRQCHNDGGTPIFSDCGDCEVAAVPTTWSAIKSRFY